MLRAVHHLVRRYCLFFAAFLILSACPLACAEPGKSNERISVARLSINFEPNQGQVNPQTKFQARAGNVKLELRPGEVNLTFAGLKSKRTALALDFIHANRNASITGSERRQTETNYLLGRDPSPDTHARERRR